MPHTFGLSALEVSQNESSRLVRRPARVPGRGFFGLSGSSGNHVLVFKLTQILQLLESIDLRLKER
jgi:hypothetical protein